MSETKKITKGLFCCVGSFRALALTMVILLLICSTPLTAFAVDVNGNEFVDIDNYAEYSFYDDNTKVFVDCQFPTDWIQTRVFQGGYGSDDLVSTHYGSSVNITADVTGTMLYMRPFGGNAQVGDNVGKQIKNTHIIDLTYIPKNSSFHTDFYVFVDFDVDQFSPDPEDFEGYQRLFFVDKNGVVVGRHFKWVRPEFTDGPSTEYCFKFCFENDLSTMNIPDTAVGVVPVYQLWDETTDFDYRITGIEYFPFQFTYMLSALEYEAQENQKIKSTLENVQSALSAQNDKIDKLPDQIGDQMQNVMDNEKEQSKDEGNKFVDQILDKLPDPSQGILSALGDLTSAINYTGTDATLKIPAIVLPAIGGLFPETEIWGGTDFSFSEYVEMLPSGLLTLVKSLFTIAIVLFCVYELKGIISYCLTLREKDGG